MNDTEDHVPEARLLDHNDLQSPTWRKLKEHLTAKLITLRAKNDSNLDPVATALLRGEIKAVKNMLALGERQVPADGADEE